MQEEAFDVEYIPALQTEYEEEPSAHAAPAGQEKQSSRDEEPTTVEYLPAPHMVQSASVSCSAAEEAASTLFVPTGQSVQAAAPTESAYFPATQTAQSSRES